MGSWEAPGPDGYQPGFFKKTWDTTRACVHQFVKEILEGKEVLEEAAVALLVLVPKQTKPCVLKYFRPMSLCNVSIKLVTKVIANRLKMYLRDL